MSRALARIAALAVSVTLLWAATASASQRPILVIGGDHENPPYEYLDGEKPTGFNVELMRAAAVIAGFDAEIRLGPWVRARRDLEQGNVDALSGMYYSEERSKLVDFSVPHTMVRSALFVRQDSPIRSFADLRGKEVILQEGDVLHDLFKRNGLASRIVAVTDPDEQLRLLTSGRGDCAIMTSRLQGEYFVKRLKLTGLRIIDADLPQLRYCFAVRKGNRELLYRLDEGLNILKVSGKYKEIYERWFGVHERRDLSRYGSYVGLALAILSGLFTVILLWSGALRRQVRFRTAALQASEQELRRAHAELEQRVDERTSELRRANEQLRVSEAEKGILLNSTADLVTFLDTEMRIQWGNHKAAALAGTSPAGLKGRQCWEAFHGRGEPCPACPVVLAMAAGEPRSAELARPEGRMSFLRAYPIENDEGRLVGTAEFALDITERKRMEEALRESEARYARLAATVPGVLYEFARHPDGSGRFTYLSPRCAEVLEVDGQAMLDDLDVLYRMMHPDDMLALQRASLSASRSRTPFSIEVRITTPSGRQKWIQFLSRPSRALGGGVETRSGLILDVTERRRMEEALRESEERFRETNELLREADRRKDEFLAMLSHELRNPLAPIRNSIYVLRRITGAGDQLERALAVLDRQTQHMTRIVDDLLDVTRISRGKITLQRERVDLNELVRGVVDDHREVFARARIELAFQDLPQQLHVYGDRTRLAQALGNLLGNSAKFTPAGGRTGVSLVGHEGDAMIQVRDTGEGVAPEMRHRLFDPFFQADRTLDRSRGGLGLGLALVKGLVEMHGGDVQVKSEGSGKGATFTVRLPLGREAGSHLTVVSRGGGCAPSRRVLIIEDNLDAAQTLKEALEMGDHQVELAHRGEEGVEKARAFQPDVVLCDIGLPGMDGYAVVHALRADPQLRSLHVIALSGYASPEDIERSRKAGFDHHVAKPTDLDALEKILVESP